MTMPDGPWMSHCHLQYMFIAGDNRRHLAVAVITIIDPLTSWSNYVTSRLNMAATRRLGKV